MLKRLSTALIAATTLSAAAASQAETYELKLFDPGVTHICVITVPENLRSTAATTTLMTLRYEGWPTWTPGYSSIEALLYDQLAMVYAKGTSLDPSSPVPKEFDAGAVSQTLNDFAIAPAYRYRVFATTNWDDYVRTIAAAMATPLDAPAGSPTNLPALVPLFVTLGQDPSDPSNWIAVETDYSHWGVVTGLLASSDPSVDPSAEILGFSIDEPTYYNLDEEGMPLPSNLWYANGSAGYLDAMLGPVRTGIYQGQYVAVIPMAAAVPEPSTLLMLLTGLVGLIGLGRKLA